MVVSRARKCVEMLPEKLIKSSHVTYATLSPLRLFRQKEKKRRKKNYPFAKKKEKICLADLMCTNLLVVLDCVTRRSDETNVYVLGISVALHFAPSKKIH